MAIEDHEQFPEWSLALDELNRSWAEYNQAKAVGYEEELLAREAAVFSAIREFRRISDAIDA